MTFIAVRCPHCQSEQIVKRGKTGCGTQRYLCQNTTCATGSFLLDYRYLGRLPAVKHQIIDMSLNASGVRDTARVLRISTDTVLRELRKKEAALESVNTAFLRTHNPDDMAVAIERLFRAREGHAEHRVARRAPHKVRLKIECALARLHHGSHAIVRHRPELSRNAQAFTKFSSDAGESGASFQLCGALHMRCEIAIA